jgi:hypothetical protein
MSFKRYSTILATSALVALGGSAFAQDKSGENLDLAATGGTAQSVVGNIDAAQKVYAWGVANGSAIAVTAAAEIMSSVDIKDVEREVAQAAVEGSATNDTDGSGTAVIDAAAMLDKARELAGDDAEMVARIDDISEASSRGRIGGASRTLSRLPAGYQDTWRVPFYGGVMAELAIVGDGDAPLHLLVTDDNGHRICADSSRTDQVYCSWTPRWDGYFIVTVKNAGSVRNSYYILTN